MGEKKHIFEWIEDFQENRLAVEEEERVKKRMQEDEEFKELFDDMKAAKNMLHFDHLNSINDKIKEEEKKYKERRRKEKIFWIAVTSTVLLTSALLIITG